MALDEMRSTCRAPGLSLTVLAPNPQSESTSTFRLQTEIGDNICEDHPPIIAFSFENLAAYLRHRILCAEFSKMSTFSRCCRLIFFASQHHDHIIMIGKFIFLICLTLVVAAEKPRRIADTATLTIFTPPLLTQNFTVDITRDVTVYLLPGESASIDFSHAFQLPGPGAEWIWIFNGEPQRNTPNAWFGNFLHFNPLESPKLTLQLKMKNSAGEILSPLVTATMLVGPKITTALPESITATEGEEIELSVDVIPAERSMFTWGVNNHTFGDHTPKVKLIPTRDMDGKKLGVLVINPMGAATSTTVLTVNMAPWKIGLIVMFIVLAVGGAVAGGLIFLKKKGYFNKKVEYVNTPTIAGEDDDGLLDEDLELAN